MRNAIKRWARRMLVHVSGAARPVGGSRMDHVITYHGIGGGREAACVGVSAYGAQMRFLASSCHVAAPTAPVADANTALRTSVRITVDDGHISALDVAAPILERLALPAIFFIPTDSIGRPSHLRKEHIRQLSDAGFAIGSHSCSHRPMGALSPAKRRRECIDSRSILEDITGRIVDAFAYPFGTLIDFGPRIEPAVAAAGYSWAFTSQHGPVSGVTHRLRIPRINIENSDSLDMFARIVRGAMDPWVWIDRYCWWLQRGAHRRCM
jgi:peptidoglycan/xylan/chitin deacetylase (PgdA/CDA1 family)